MTDVRISKKNTITFKRVDIKSCTHYEIYAIQKRNNLEFLLDTVDNPKTPNPFSKSKFLTYNDKQIWELEEGILAKTSVDISVFVNDVKLTPLQYTFNPMNRTLDIHIGLKERDSIKVNYNVDRLSYIHYTDEEYGYRIAPIFRNGYRVGEHSLLKY